MQKGPWAISALTHDYETIKVVSAQKQESTPADSKVWSGISAPPGLDGSSE